MLDQSKHLSTGEQLASAGSSLEKHSQYYHFTFGQLFMLIAFVIQVTENKAQPTSLRLRGIQKRGHMGERSRDLCVSQKGDEI